MIEKESFRSYKLDDERDDKDITFTTRLTEEDKEWFLPAKVFIEQSKQSTAMKQLAKIGAYVVLHDQKTHQILDILLNNSRKNQRLGISEEELKKIKKWQK